MEIQLKLYGSSKILSDKDTLKVQLPNNSNVQKLRDILTEIISKKYSLSNIKNAPYWRVFFVLDNIRLVIINCQIYKIISFCHTL